MHLQVVIGLALLAPAADAKSDSQRPAELVAVLIQGLANETPATRYGAARDLGNMGKAAHAAAGPLVKALRDPNRDVRDRADKALAQIGRAAVPELLGALADRDDELRSR